MSSDETRGPREIAYDTEIAPLMTQIIATCKRAGIPVVASFELDCPEDDPDVPTFCTTAIVHADSAPSMRRCADIMMDRGRRPMAFTETTTTNPDGTRHIAIRRAL